MEIEDLRRRLKKAERDLVNSKEECTSPFQRIYRCTNMRKT
jgi:hypothetical protein